MTDLSGNDIDTLFIQGQEIVKRLDQMDSTNEKYEETLAKGMEIFQQVRTMVHQQGLFSPNEEISDVITRNLKFFLVDYYVATLQNKFIAPETRFVNVRKSIEYFHAFLYKCEEYGLFEPAEEEDWKAIVEQDEVDEGSRMNRIINPTAIREKKIERFRREKEAKQRMQELQRVIAQIEKKNDSQTLDSDLEDYQRELSLLAIKSSIRQTFDELHSLEQEKQILEVMGTMGANVPREERRPPPGVGCQHGLSVTYIDNLNGQLAIERENIRGNVFRPSHILPTMMPEDFAEIEIQRVKEREEQAKNNPYKPVKKYKQLEEDGEEDNEELVDQAIYKDRSWDDWTDMHEKGIGNKANKRI